MVIVIQLTELQYPFIAYLLIHPMIAIKMRVRLNK